MKKMTKFFALALLAGAMVSCSTEDTAPSTQNDKVAVQFTGGISVNTRASGTTWDNGDRIGITDIDNDPQYGNVPFILKNGKFESRRKGHLYRRYKDPYFPRLLSVQRGGRHPHSHDRCHGAAEPACHRLPLCFRSHGRQKQPGGELHRQNRQRR